MSGRQQSCGDTLVIRSIGGLKLMPFKPMKLNVIRRAGGFSGGQFSTHDIKKKHY